MKPDIYKQLAATGKFYNTGKVLIGVQYTPKNHRIMSRDEELIQSALLGHPIPRLSHDMTIYALYVLGVALLAAALAKVFS